MYRKTTFFSVIDTLASDNHLRFRKNLSERIEKLIMTINDKIRYEKLQYDNNKEALSSGKTGKTKKNNLRGKRKIKTLENGVKKNPSKINRFFVIKRFSK